MDVQTKDKNLKWINGSTLDANELYKIAAIDIKIPLEFDKSHIADEICLKNTLDRYDKNRTSDFFMVVYEASEIVAFHVIHSRHPMAHIQTLWVHPNYRKKGIAKSLKEAGARWAKETGHTHIQTNVHAINSRMNRINIENGFEAFSTTYRSKL